MLRRDDKYKRPIGVLFDNDEGRRIVGHLKLKKGDLLDSNVVSIVNDSLVHITDGDSLHGVSEAGKVSLLDCIRGGLLSTTTWGNFSIHHGDISFRYALFGKHHINIDEKCIRGIQFTLDGVESSVFVHDRFEKFGHLYDPDKEILDAIERNRPDYLKGDFVQGKAMVSYFTGDWDLLPRFKTVLGTLHVGRSMQIDFHGRNMEDTPRVRVDFDDEPVTLNGALEKMREIRQFFAWMMGYAPGWKDVQVFTSRLDEKGRWADAESILDVFGPNEWKHVPEDARRFGALIDASLYPDHFAEVMAKWLERNGNGRRKSANSRYFGSLQGITDRFIEDSIVSAANTFDLIPNEDKPKAKNGRTLRDVVEHRAKIVLEHFGSDRLQRIDEVIWMAVKCRNYYTHGPRGQNTDGIDYTDFELVIFLARTLEFIYGASELLLCGWDISKSAAHAWHPLGGFVESYDHNRSMISQLE